MAKKIANSTNGLELLKSLLTSDQEHRQQLAFNLHAKKATISGVAMQLSIMGKDLKRGKKIEAQALEDLRGYLNELTEDLRPIHAGMSPPKVYILGLTTPLRTYMRNVRDSYNIEVEMDCPEMEKAKMAKNHQAGIYRICTSVVDHLLQTGANRIILHAEIKRGNFVLSLFGYPPRKGTKQRIFLDKSLDLIKALLIWQEAVVNETTDWQHVFSFRFKMR